ncbi:Lar family restriction alleviation protein [Candidimonas nitroreducens]|nr:Lar family restriction alleviation protein [Candidimonas nitroreducens]
MSDDPKLLPCPFCGHEAEHVHIHHGEEVVLCANEGCNVHPSVHGSTAEKAAARWNRRGINSEPAVRAYRDRVELMLAIINTGQILGIVRPDLESASTVECAHILECITKPVLVAHASVDGHSPPTPLYATPVAVQPADLDSAISQECVSDLDDEQKRVYFSGFRQGWVRRGRGALPTPNAEPLVDIAKRRAEEVALNAQGHQQAINAIDFCVAKLDAHTAAQPIVAWQNKDKPDDILTHEQLDPAWRSMYLPLVYDLRTVRDITLPDGSVRHNVGSDNLSDEDRRAMDEQAVEGWTKMASWSEAEPFPVQPAASAAPRKIGVIRNGAHGHPYATLETAYDEHGKHWKGGEAIYAAPIAAQPTTARVPAATVSRKGGSIGSLVWTEAGRMADLPDGTMLFVGRSDTTATGQPDSYNRELCRQLEQEWGVLRGMIDAEERAAMTPAARDVLVERRRQVSVEGFTPEKDDTWFGGVLANAAQAYAHNATYTMRGHTTFGVPPVPWPWAVEWWKPSTSRRDLVKAGALILAEIERMDRKAAKEDQS